MKVIHSNNRCFYFISTFFLLLLTFYILGCSSIFSYTCGRDDTVSQIILPVQLYLTSLFLVGIITEHYHIIPLFITVILLLLVAYLLQNLYKKNGFELEGVLRKNIKHNDKLMDDYVMSIVK